MPNKREPEELSPQAAGRMRPKEVLSGVKGRRGAGEIRFTINSRGGSRWHPGWLRQASGLQTVGLAGGVPIPWLLIKGHNSSPGNVLHQIPRPRQLWVDPGMPVTRASGVGTLLLPPPLLPEWLWRELCTWQRTSATFKSRPRLNDFM